MSTAVTKWREKEQARNLAAALVALPSGAPLLVWCGNSHLSRASVGEFAPMGHQFSNLTRVEAFAIDQTVTVAWSEAPSPHPLIEQFADQLRRLGGSGGCLVEEVPPGWTDRHVDAVVLSLENELA